jgi:hypothetical protein
MVNYFAFNDTIPATNNNPSTDQPVMLSNNASDLGIWSQDHIGYNTNYGGYHLQTTFPSFSTPPSLPGNPSSVAYPAAGTANATNASYYFENFTATYLLNCVKAFGVFTAGVAPSFSNQYNCASVTGSGVGPYTITLESNVVTGNNVIVFINTSSGDVPKWSFSGGVLTTTSGVTNASKVCFAILQA